MGRVWVFKSVFSQSRDVRVDVRACVRVSQCFFFLREGHPTRKLTIGGLHPRVFFSAMLRTRDMQ